jgi:hypothetical protein
MSKKLDRFIQSLNAKATLIGSRALVDDIGTSADYDFIMGDKAATKLMIYLEKQDISFSYSQRGSESDRYDTTINGVIRFDYDDTAIDILTFKDEYMDKLNVVVDTMITIANLSPRMWDDKDFRVNVFHDSCQHVVESYEDESEESLPFD